MKFGRAIPTPIRIMPTDSHGFIVDIGFATFACETSDAVLDLLQEYLNVPSTFIDKLEIIRGKGKELARVGTDSKLKSTPNSGPGPIIRIPRDGKVDSTNF